MKSKHSVLIRKILSFITAVTLMAGNLAFTPVATVAAPKALEFAGTYTAPTAAIKGAQNMGTLDNTAKKTYWFGGNAFYGMKRNGIEFGEDYDTSDWLLADTDAMWNGNYLFSTWGNGYNNKAEDKSDLYTYSVNADADVTAKKEKNFYYQKILTYNEALYQQKVKGWLKGKEADAIGAATVTTTGGEYRTYEDHVQAASGEADANKYNYYIGAMDVSANPLTAGFSYVIDYVKKWYETGQKDTSKYLPVNDGYPVLKGSAGATDQTWITKNDGVVTYKNETGTYINNTDYNGITETDLGVQGSNIYSLKNAHLFSPSQMEYSGNEKVYKAIINNIRNDATSSTTDDVDVSSTSDLYYASASIPGGSKGYPSAAKQGKYTWGNAPKNPQQNLWDRTRTNLWSRSFSGLRVGSGGFGAWRVGMGGDLYSDNNLARSYAVAPAFNLDTSSVVMAHAANAAGTAALSAYDANNLGTNDVTFELETDKLNIETDWNGMTIKNLVPGETFSIPYKSITVNTESSQAGLDGTYISAGIYDKSNNLLYYGRLASASTTTTPGTVAFTVPEDLEKGKDYKLAIFVEQINGSYEVKSPMQVDKGLTGITTYTTDYASKMNVATFQIDYTGSENPDNGWHTWTDENGIVWNYVQSSDNTADRLWTAAADITSLIKDDTLMVPSRINGLKVTGIGGGARGKQFVKTDATGTWDKINFPASITTINDLAFVDFENAMTLEFPATVKYIGQKAFENCTGITSVVMDGCTGLVEEEAFKNCSGIASLVINEGERVLVIGERAFENCAGVDKITLPSNVTMQAYAFKNCAVSTLNIDAATIPANSFADCMNISTVYLGNNVLSVDYNWNGQVTNQDNDDRVFVVKSGNTKFDFYKEGSVQYSAFGSKGNVYFYHNVGLDSTYTDNDNVRTITATSLAAHTMDTDNYSCYYKDGGVKLANNVTFSSATSISDSGNETIQKYYHYLSDGSSGSQTGITASSLATLYWATGSSKGTTLSTNRIVVKAAYGNSKRNQYDSDHVYVVRAADYSLLSEAGIKAAKVTATQDDLDKGYVEVKVVVFENYDGTEYTEIPAGGRYTADIKVRVDEYDDQGYVEEKYSSFKEIVDAIDDLEGEITTIQEQADAVKAALEADKAALESDKAALETEKNALTADLETKTNEATNLTAQLAAKQAELTALYAALEEYTNTSEGQSYTGVTKDNIKVVFIGNEGTPYDETGKTLTVNSKRYDIYKTKADAKDAADNVLVASGSYFYVADDGVHVIDASEYNLSGTEYLTVYKTSVSGNDVLFTKDSEGNITVVENNGGEYTPSATQDEPTIQAIEDILDNNPDDVTKETGNDDVYSDSLAASIAAANEKLEALQKSLNDAKSSLESITAGLTSIVTELMNQGAELTLADINNYQKICSEIAALIEKIKKEAAENSGNDEIIKNLEASLTKLQEEYDKVNAKNDELQKEYDKVNAKNDELQKEYDKVNAKNNELQEEYDKVNAKNDELQKENDKVNAKNDELQKENEELKKGGGSGNGGGGYDDSIESVVVVFKPNKTGADLAADKRTKIVTNGKAYGEMPTPTCTGFTFIGWYTNDTNGTLIQSSSIVLATEATINLYAHWSEETEPAEDKTVVEAKAIDQPTDGIIKAEESVVPGKTKWKISPSFNAVQVNVSDKKVVKAKIKKKDGSITVNAKKAGTADVVVSGSGGETYTYRVYVEVPKMNKTALKTTTATTSMNLIDYMTGTSKLVPTSVKSSDESVAAVSSNGLLEIKSSGKTKINIFFGKKKYKGTLKVA